MTRTKEDELRRSTDMRIIHADIFDDRRKCINIELGGGTLNNRAEMSLVARFQNDNYQREKMYNLLVLFKQDF